jgi:hypothetical protein
MWLGVLSVLFASEPLKTFDGRHDISRIHVTVVYFVPRDRTPLPDWQDRVRYYCRRMERFHAREFGEQSRLTASLVEKPFISAKKSDELRAGDRDFIFFTTLGEVEAALKDQLHRDDAYPILLVMSDINWGELEDFYRLRVREGQREFEGQLIEGRHFPGAASGGARSLYMPDRGLGWGLVSADGWRVPYSGSDCVAYHEGVGHPIGLPHPEPADGSVMSLAQYRYWINQTWVHEGQKEKLGWTPPDEDSAAGADLFSRFTALPEPLQPRPGQDVALRFTWPDAARVKQCSIRLQTQLFGPWLEVPRVSLAPSPESLPVGRFDRSTPVSYRVNAVLEDGQDVELWGYFQVRAEPDQPPLPPPTTVPGTVDFESAEPSWKDTVDLLALIDPERDGVAGKWSLEDDGLEANKQYGARIEIPYRPPGEYVLTVIVEPLDPPNGLILGQRSGDRRFLVLVNFRREGQPTASALENVDGLNVGRNATTIPGDLLTQHRPSTLVCTVREQRVSVTCDGRPIIDWRGDAARLSLSDYWQTPRAEALFLGAYDCRYRFHRVTLTPITGKGQVLVSQP